MSDKLSYVYFFSIAYMYLLPISKLGSTICSQILRDREDELGESPYENRPLVPNLSVAQYTHNMN